MLSQGNEVKEGDRAENLKNLSVVTTQVHTGTYRHPHTYNHTQTQKTTAYAINIHSYCVPVKRKIKCQHQDSRSPGKDTVPGDGSY